ncbi:MAG: four helix bundle protein [Blastocatellia bacterium]|nr:four helix bundle protein [Blastocatellia bacterium]
MSTKIEKFEDLIAWQKARKLTVRIYETTGGGSFARDFNLKDQIRRASVSVMPNIAEGFQRNSAADFHRFLVMAKGSCAELRNQLYIALDVAHIPGDEFNSLMREAIEVARIIGGLRAAVQRRRAKPESAS